MPVNSKIQYFLDQLNTMPAIPMDQITPEAMRRSEASQLAAQPKEPVEKVEDRTIPLAGRSLPIRVYTPKGEAPYPALVFYHGGGWVLGSIESHDAICRELANLASCVVISVEYRLAPEHKFPAAVDDAYESLEWIASHAADFEIDPGRIAVGGDSAGGNLATVACLIAKERKGPNIVHQLLLYPSAGPAADYPSMAENAKGYLLTGEMMGWFQTHYLQGDEDRAHPYLSPILSENLEGLPPATILTAQYDPLRDVGIAYAEKLQAQGVKVFHKNYADLIHGFANFSGFVPEARQAVADGAEELKKSFVQ
ncbi:alpha/beta hydrolase [Planomicrobium sp. CPCC 101079]|uniref:alpha/beta hydrolase n=1 Tax=Planomicrobium sp. CPCC 101079 TaxID=2599618 RepID=UPI0011B71F82|nr:alpha/beta hydrolase [Planomicrobium sp. CPCC 101079]TWT01538.1 alpha/beta hydrolase [Planomicrobium sp. CPCC 101079]